MKTKKISLLVISVLILASIGGVVAWQSRNFDGEGHVGCHNSGATESIDGTIVDPDAPTVPGGIKITPSTKLNPGQRFNASVIIVNFTEVNSVASGRRFPSELANVTVQISSHRGDNINFGFGWEDFEDDKADTGYWLVEEEVLDASGNSSEISFWMVAPSSSGYHTLVIDAISAINNSEASGDDSIPIIFATANVTIYVRRVLLAAAGDDDDDRDLWKEETIPGYILIITLGTIFAVSAVLILRIKKKMKKTSRNV